MLAERVAVRREIFRRCRAGAAALRQREIDDRIYTILDAIQQGAAL